MNCCFETINVIHKELNLNQNYLKFYLKSYGRFR